ncbi:MAG: pyridoxamine 5'-phosphate oxidase [Gammaproteobacteria bacterium]|jgi:pyridoxamine 5'-phosphate oxidase
MTDPATNFLTSDGLLPAPLPEDPMPIAAAWLAEATERRVQPNPNAVVIATVDQESQPSARVVLCKALYPEPGYLVFYTNYQSRKARDLAVNSRVCALFHWDALGRQVRIEGNAVRSPAEESDDYFASRPRGSQLGAWASDQSDTIASREALLEQLASRADDLGVAVAGTDVADEGPPIPRPLHWGGYRLWAARVELWVEGAARIHDRALWERHLTRESEYAFRCGPWNATRLQP